MKYNIQIMDLDCAAENKPRKCLPPEKEMNLSIVMARWPDPEDLLLAVDNLSIKNVTQENL